MCWGSLSDWNDDVAAENAKRVIAKKPQESTETAGTGDDYFCVIKSLVTDSM